MQKIKTSLIITLIIIICIFSTKVYGFSTNFMWSAYDNSVETSAILNEEIDNNSLNLEAGSAILIEQNSGKILYGYNIHEKLRPASVTKIMSLILIMEALDSGKITLETQIPCSSNAASMGGSQIWLDTTETLSVNDMLKAITVVSANDCVMALAEYLGGTEAGFVQMMNNKAKELGMNDTSFKNCHGIDEDDHLTSAYDIALMSRELLTKHPMITNYTTIWMDSLRDGKSTLSNTNKLVRNYNGCTGLKTGSTSLALFNLSASATRDNLSLIAVVMKAPTSAIRFKDATALLDYGFSNYSYKDFGNKNDIIKNIAITKGVTDNVNAIYEDTPSFLIKKGQDSQITYDINIPDIIQAPISKGEKLGTVTYSLNGEILKTVNVVAENDVKKIEIFSMFEYIYEKWGSLLRK